MTTSPEERARINRTLQALKEELTQQDTVADVKVYLRTSPGAAERIRRLSDELRSLSARPEEG